MNEESRLEHVPEITEETVVDKEQIVEEECVLCENSTQHKCTICGEKNDPKCKSNQYESMQFECPICCSTFNYQSELGTHMSNHAEPSPMPSLISNADDSSWTYVTCTECDGKFDNEMDMKYHKQRVHEFGETCSMYPCEECGFQGTDKIQLKTHVEEHHPKNCYNKRIKQNLKFVNFDEESDDEVEKEWTPNHDDEALVAEEQDHFLPMKRKRTENNMPQTKRRKTDHTCPKCQKTFSRQDSLNRHIRSYSK